MLRYKFWKDSQSATELLSFLDKLKSINRNVSSILSPICLIYEIEIFFVNFLVEFKRYNKMSKYDFLIQ